VGFDINREDWSQQLQAMAAASGGQYLAARQGDVLLRELRTAVFETPDAFTLFDSTNKPIFTGQFGQSMQLPAGKYRIRATYAGRTFEENAWVNAGTTTAVTFQAAQASGPSAQEVKGEATAPEGAPAAAVPPAPGQAAAPAPGQAPAAAATPAPEQAPAPGAAQPAGKKFCTQCGAALKPGAKFCTSCGAKTGQ